jgi:V/A-type H+-transporting ATPase subunit B
MKDGIGAGMTREDHSSVASQLFASYSKVKSIRNLAAIIGEEEVSPLDKLYLKFGRELEERFFTQGEYENRSIDETLDLGWKILSILPREELYRIKDEYIDRYLPKNEDAVSVGGLEE